MRSYYAHIQTAAPESESIVSRPVFRSSAIFPVLHQKDVSSRVLFLGYWMIKRNIDKISAIVTLRSSAGEVLARRLLTVTEAKAYCLELEDLLEISSLADKENFYGTQEIEFYSDSNLVFPFPAVVVNYYGPAFSSVVHTAQRVYNDYEDMKKNSQTAVPESGFNIRTIEGCEPFIGLINGAETQENCEVALKFFNRDGKILEHIEKPGTLKPYETRFLYPAKSLDLASFLDGHEGACKATFAVKWIFPRLLVGNIQAEPRALSITHSYYDCSAAASDSDYWRYFDSAFHPASLMLPIRLDKGYFTNAYFYPIYSPSTLAIDVELYSEEGTFLGSTKDFLTLKSPGDRFAIIPFNEIAKKLGADSAKSARIIARPLAQSPLPSRIKLALDIGQENKGLPCNICMNLQLYNPASATKKFSFKWLPFLADQPEPSIWIMNSSPEINYRDVASLEMTFYREKDTATLKRIVELPPQGCLILKRDPELDAFFENHPGWVTIVTHNPYLSTYYFADHPSGTVGGDHGF